MIQIQVISSNRLSDEALDIADTVPDEALEEVGISRDDFNKALFSYDVQGNEDAFQELEIDED